ncbi:MAG TPA: protein kinase [Mycobacteriales bacterium]|nr:protein kinase [Mycobacteriales bacterium]
MESAGRVVGGGRYRLLGQLGAGGMGTVWRAEDTLLGRQVAIKEVTFPAGVSPEEAEVLRERTRREARAAGRLSHPNAVTVFDVLEEDGRPWLVMELVESRTLAQAVAQDGPLPAGRAAQVGLALLGALEAAHARGILHRDVKPSNVLLAPAGAGQPERVVLTDFGIATSADDPSLTSSGLLLGSPGYIAPERAGGQTPGPASDLWSLGATLFTAVEGRPPFDAGEPLLTVTAVLTGNHAPYALAGPLVPALDGLLEKDPGRRLDAAGARAALQSAAREPAPPQRTLPLPAADPPTQAGATQAGHTAALDLGEVRREAARGAPPAWPARPVRTTAPPAALPVRRRRTPALLGAGALVLALLAGGAVALARGTGGNDPATAAAQPNPTTAAPSPPTAPPPAGSTSPPATPRASSPATPRSAAPTPQATTPAAGSPDLPAGWTTHSSGGWTAAVPASYAVRSFGGFPEYRDPATGRTLRVSTGTGRPDAVADREQQARSFAGDHPDYRQIRIEAADYRGYPAADWEFTYEGLHVFNRVFVVNGRGHSLWWQTRQADFAASRADLERVLATFRPAGS